VARADDFRSPLWEKIFVRELGFTADGRLSMSRSQIFVTWEKVMRRLVSLLLGLLVLILPSPARADLFCDKPQIQAGDVRSGEALSHRFTFVNQGSEVVEITQIRPSCGCLTPRLEQRRFRPGEQGAFELAVDTLTQAAGPQSWSVRLAYQNGNEPRELTFTLSANLIPEISVEPSAVVVMFTHGALSRTITLTERRPEPLTLAGVRTTSPYMRASVGEPRRDSEGHWSRIITLEILPDFPEGPHDESLVIAKAERQDEWRVPVTIVKRSRDRVLVAPEAVTLNGPLDQQSPRLVRISGKEQDVVLEHVEADDPAVQCEWVPGPGRHATLKVRLDPARVRGDSLQCTVRVQLRQPPQTIAIPVTWTRP
jgi:hypothetical protein